MTPERLAEIREKHGRSYAYLATQLDPAELAETAYGFNAELLAEVDRLNAELADADGAGQLWQDTAMRLKDRLAKTFPGASA